MKEFFQSVLRRTTWEMRQSRLGRRWVRKKARTNYIVEFIGPSGVGKSYMLDAIPAAERRKWWTRSDLRIAQACCQSEELYGFLINDQMERMKNESGFTKTDRLLRWFLTVLRADMACNSVLPEGSLLDEGLFGNFGDVVVAVLNDPSHRHHKKLTQNRAFVCVHSDRDQIFNRIRARQKEMPKHNPNHWGLDDGELRSLIDDSIRVSENLVQSARAVGCPVVMVNNNDVAAAQMPEIFKEFSDGLRLV